MLSSNPLKKVKKVYPEKSLGGKLSHTVIKVKISIFLLLFC
jgi:hypothetical protein